MATELENQARQIREGISGAAYLHKLGQSRSQPINLAWGWLIVMILAFLFGWFLRLPALVFVGIAMYIILTILLARDNMKLFGTYMGFALLVHVITGVVSYFQPPDLQLTFMEWLVGGLFCYTPASLLYNGICILFADL